MTVPDNVNNMYIMIVLYPSNSENYTILHDVKIQITMGK